MLTREQRILFDFLRHYVTKHRGVGPTFDEMRDALGLRSKSGVHRVLVGLEERGFIRRIPKRPRAIEILSRALGEREARLRSVATDLVDQFGLNATAGEISHVPPEMIRAIREALR